MMRAWPTIGETFREALARRCSVALFAGSEAPACAVGIELRAIESSCDDSRTAEPELGHNPTTGRVLARGAKSAASCARCARCERLQREPRFTHRAERWNAFYGASEELRHCGASVWQATQLVTLVRGPQRDETRHEPSR